MRSDLIETFILIVNRKYDINPELSFQLGEGDRRRHDHKLFKKRFRLMLGNTCFPTELLYKSFIHYKMVAQKEQRQTEYNETYTQITIKHYKKR